MRTSTNETESTLWSMALGGQAIDSSALAAALAREVADPPDELDFRTRLLIRDSMDALNRHWSREGLLDWLGRTAGGKALEAIWRSELGEPGFPSLTHRVMETTKAETVLQYLRELGLRCTEPTRLEIGGAIALILPGILGRRTEDIDVVDEIPAALRTRHELLQELDSRYGLHLAHFQSHFLPSGWRDRLHFLGRYGELEVLLVDACDVFVSKLFSARVKDRDDLRAMAHQLDKSSIEKRLRESAGALMAEARLAQLAADNWYVVYGQKLGA